MSNSNTDACLKNPPLQNQKQLETQRNKGVWSSNKPVGIPKFLCLDGQGHASHCETGFIQMQQGLVQVILLTVPLSVSQESLCQVRPLRHNPHDNVCPLNVFHLLRENKRQAIQVPVKHQIHAVVVHLEEQTKCDRELH